MKKTIILFLALGIIGAGAYAQEEDAGGFQFQAGIALGTDVIVNGLGVSETWNSLGFQPDLGFGQFGIGLDLTIRFQLSPANGDAIAIYPGDWVPDYEGSGKTFLDLYLPKLMYLRYGFKGDPLYAKLGSIEDFTLGNGFIVGNYANTRFLPEQRIFGLQLNIDGALFGFPYVGLELLTGNLARFDVLGARLFVRPLIATGIPILSDLQVGGTVATDLNPELWALLDPDPASTYTEQGLDPVTVFGTDIFLPIIKSKVFPLAAFTELAFQPEGRTGYMLGAGGKAFGLITYGAQLRLLSAGFLPNYFDANYDIFRAVKAAFMATTPGGDGFAGWFAKLGLSLFNDLFYIDVMADGPFAAKPAAPSLNTADYPHLRGVLGLREGVLGGFFFDFAYDKYALGRNGAFGEELVDPTDAVITAAANFRTGAAVFTLMYNLTWNPQTSDFDVTSSLQSSIKF